MTCQPRRNSEGLQSVPATPAVLPAADTGRGSARQTRSWRVPRRSKAVDRRSPEAEASKGPRSRREGRASARRAAARVEGVGVLDRVCHRNTGTIPETHRSLAAGCCRMFPAPLQTQVSSNMPALQQAKAWHSFAGLLSPDTHVSPLVRSLNFHTEVNAFPAAANSFPHSSQ